MASDSNKQSDSSKDKVYNAHLRENEVSEQGEKPQIDRKSMAIVSVVGLILLVVGGVVLKPVFKSGFHYNQYVEKGYKRAKVPGGEAQTSSVNALVAYNRLGKKLFSAKCAGCHQSNGFGDGANFPPLRDSEWVTGNSRLAAMIILNGLQGSIEVAGKQWNGVMPPQGSGLSAKDLAAILTYIRNNFGNEVGDIVSIEMAQEAMNLSEKRTQKGLITVKELKAQHDLALSGNVVESSTQVDRQTLEPIK